MNYSRGPIVKLKFYRTLVNETVDCTLAGALPHVLLYRRIQLAACTTEFDWVELLTSPHSWMAGSRTIIESKAIMLLRDSHNLSPTWERTILQSLLGALG